MIRIVIRLVLYVLGVRYVHIGRYERGLLFRRGEFVRVLGPSWHWHFDPLRALAFEVVSVRTARFDHDQLDAIVKSGVLEGEVAVHALADHERGLVWVDGRFESVLTPGLHVYWTVFRNIKIEVVSTGREAFAHPELAAILAGESSAETLESHTVPQGSVAVLLEDGRIAGVLSPGRYAYWKGTAERSCEVFDLREQTLDIAGQDIMTADKVTLRLNAVVTYRLDDVRVMYDNAREPNVALYREAQLVLRAIVGTMELDALLADKDILAEALEERVRARANQLGLRVTSVGVRDVILPGDMRNLLNKVMEARKAAEANLITRREETAAMRSQVNTAQLLDKHPTLMRMRELEVLAKVAEQSKLNVVLGEKGLADRVVNLL